ncbi:MAG: sulfatase-like hydrolase/transferase [Candidatus Rifleibacteriota bacterium]
MNQRSFFIIAGLQLTTAFFIVVRVLQEIFLANPNFLTDITLSPLIMTVLAATGLALIQFRSWFSEQRLFILLNGLFCLAGLTCAALKIGGLFTWILVFTGLGFLLLFGIELFLNKILKSAGVLFLLLNALLIVMLQIDWHVFSVTRAHLNFQIISVVWQDQALLFQAAKYLGIQNRQIFSDLLLLLLIGPFFGLLVGFFKSQHDEKDFRIQALAVSILLLLVHYGEFDLVCRNTSMAEYISLRISSGIVPLPLHPALKADEMLQKVLQSPKKVNPDRCYSPAAIEIRPNHIEKIVLVGIESLRYDAFAELMTNTRLHSENGRLLVNHYSNSNISLSSFFSLLHSNFPVNLMFSPRRYEKSRLELTAESAGYATWLIKPELIGSAAPEIWGNNRMIDKVEKPWQTTPKVFERTLELLRQPGRSMILTYVFNTHFNYYYPPEFEKYQPVCPDETNIFTMWPSPENVAKIRNRYNNSVLYLDHCLNEFLNLVKEEALDQKTLIVIFGDHGQSLRETGCLGHGTGASVLQYRVPFIVLGPGVDTQVIDYPTSHFNALSEALKPAGFAINSPFSALDGNYPVLALEESVSGRILVIQKDYINIFDLTSEFQLRWIAMVNLSYAISPELVQTWYQNTEKLASAIDSDMTFISSHLQ